MVNKTLLCTIEHACKTTCGIPVPRPGNTRNISRRTAKHRRYSGEKLPQKILLIIGKGNEKIPNLSCLILFSVHFYPSSLLLFFSSSLLVGWVLNLSQGLDFSRDEYSFSES
jgi:hypothetical protein